MAAEMTANEMVPEGAPPPEEPPKQESPQNSAPKKTWICGNPECRAVIEWLPPQVRHLHPSKIRCLKCQKAKKDTKAPTEVPPPVPPPAPVREAPVRAAPQQRPHMRGHNHRTQAPPVLTLEVVEACALRVGIDPAQVDSLLACIRARV